MGIMREAFAGRVYGRITGGLSTQCSGVMFPWRYIDLRGYCHRLQPWDRDRTGEGVRAFRRRVQGGCSRRGRVDCGGARPGKQPSSVWRPPGWRLPGCRFGGDGSTGLPTKQSSRSLDIGKALATPEQAHSEGGRAPGRAEPLHLLELLLSVAPPYRRWRPSHSRPQRRGRRRCRLPYSPPVSPAFGWEAM